VTQVDRHRLGVRRVLLGVGLGVTDTASASLSHGASDTQAEGINSGSESFKFTLPVVSSLESSESAQGQDQVVLVQ
jgi:hypothetical protein